jgi:predicted nucleic acid-binding protein
VSDNLRLHDNLRAILLDTNAMGSGSLNMKTLRELPKITTKFPDLEIWIPEPVIWEWASHAQQTYTDAVIAQCRLAGLRS